MAIRDLRSTYTYALLDVSPATYKEIREKLEAAGYHHVFHENDGRQVIDMHGVALAEEQRTERTTPCGYCNFGYNPEVKRCECVTLTGPT